MTQTFTIPGTLPDLNAYINAERANKYAAAKMKKDAESKIILHIRFAKLQPLTEYPVRIFYRWYCPNKRKDRSNISFAEKFVEDSLIRAGILRNDGFDDVVDGVHECFIDRANPQVVVTVGPWYHGQIWYQHWCKPASEDNAHVK